MAHFQRSHLDLQISWVWTQKLESSQGRGLNVTSLSSAATMSYRQSGLQRHSSAYLYTYSQTRKLAPPLTSPHAREALGGPGEHGACTWVGARSLWRTWATSSPQIWCLYQTGLTTWSPWTFWTWTQYWCKQEKQSVVRERPSRWTLRKSAADLLVDCCHCFLVSTVEFNC